MTILGIILVVIAFCVALYFTNKEASPTWRKPIIVGLVILFVLFLLWQAGVLGFFGMRVGK